MVSQQLCQYVKSVVGVDISQASVDLYNAQAANQGLEPEEMRAVCTELKGEPGELSGIKFDVIVVSTQCSFLLLPNIGSRGNTTPQHHPEYLRCSVAHRTTTSPLSKTRRACSRPSLDPGARCLSQTSKPLGTTASCLRPLITTLSLTGMGCPRRR